MNINSLTLPRYSRNQIVHFSGGVGTIRNYQPGSNNTWTYAIEMEMGPEPDFGRVGFETTILLHETEIQEFTPVSSEGRRGKAEGKRHPRLKNVELSKDI